MTSSGQCAAIVTGAASGIGRATAMRLAERGHAVALVDVAEDRLANVARQIRAPCTTIVADLAEPSSAERIVDATVDALGVPTVLVNAAGVLIRRGFLEHDVGSWDRTLAIDLDAPFWLSSCFVRRLIEAGATGAIVNVASIEALYPLPGHAAYSAAKGALLMLTKAMAIDVADLGIRVNAVCPGVIATGMNEDVRADRERAHALSSQIPPSRFGEPDEVARVIAFLASEEASYVTGAHLLVDGGWAAH